MPHEIRKRRLVERGLSFTLVELLVVVAIVSIMASLLMPALRGAKLKAYDMQCAQNERQIHMALMMYCNDHNNIFPDNITFDAQFHQLTDLSGMMGGSYRGFHCPLGAEDVNNGAWELCRTSAWYSTNIDGNVEWTDYKVNDDDNIVRGRDFGGDFRQLRPQRIVVLIDANADQPRHRGKNNLCFFDGHVEMMTRAQYEGPEPGYDGPFPPVWWHNWGR